MYRCREPKHEPQPAKTAEEIVSEKVRQFGQKRRDFARRVAKRQNRELSPEAEGFFDALEAGNWEEIHARWKALADRSGQYENPREKPARDPDWSAILDGYGVAEQAHIWPAQKLLDYGQAVLGSLKPGMIYVGGTDPGRWVPELLNETGEGEPRIVITQNALADNTYLEFVNALYGEQMTTLTSEDSQRMFQEYIQDAQKRLDHDQQFPDEPKQVRPGENIRARMGTFSFRRGRGDGDKREARASIDAEEPRPFFCNGGVLFYEGTLRRRGTARAASRTQSFQRLDPGPGGAVG